MCLRSLEISTTLANGAILLRFVDEELFLNDEILVISIIWFEFKDMVYAHFTFEVSEANIPSTE
jgi:hypothetical protein